MRGVGFSLQRRRRRRLKQGGSLSTATTHQDYYGMEKMTVPRVLFNGDSGGEKPQWWFCRDEVNLLFWYVLYCFVYQYLTAFSFELLVVIKFSAFWVHSLFGAIRIMYCDDFLLRSAWVYGLLSLSCIAIAYECGVCPLVCMCSFFVVGKWYQRVYGTVLILGLERL
ncbi:hypothetical protein Lal_00039310 [Lupinus albus]|nr:hypothetical protein Lal_00039310 [Lupinus albus]